MMRIMSVKTRSLLAAVLASVSISARALAQVSIAPTVGVYMPTNDLISAVIDGGGVIAFKQQVGLAIGGRMGVAFGSRVGLTATGSYVPTQLQATVTQAGITQNRDDYADLWFGTGRLNVWLLPPTSILAIGVNGGVGVVGRGATTVYDSEGTPYTTPSRTDIGGVVGATAGVNLGVIGLFVSADDYVYNPGVFEELGVKSDTQHDLQFSFGLGTRF